MSGNQSSFYFKQKILSILCDELRIDVTQNAGQSFFFAFRQLINQTFFFFDYVCWRHLCCRGVFLFHWFLWLLSFCFLKVVEVSWTLWNNKLKVTITFITRKYFSLFFFHLSNLAFPFSLAMNVFCLLVTVMQIWVMKNRWNFDKFQENKKFYLFVFIFKSLSIV